MAEPDRDSLAVRTEPSNKKRGGATDVFQKEIRV